jgi:hypothetical protein
MTVCKPTYYTSYLFEGGKLVVLNQDSVCLNRDFTCP